MPGLPFSSRTNQTDFNHYYRNTHLVFFSNIISETLAAMADTGDLVAILVRMTSRSTTPSGSSQGQAGGLCHTHHLQFPL
jgi:hypothetical protein